MHEVVNLSISSYRGSIGAEHYYGRFEVQTKYDRVTNTDGSTRLVTRSGYGVEIHPADRYELTRKLGAKEAAYLNKKDDGGFFTSSMGLKSGSTTTRFNDIDSIIAAAIAAFHTLFDETDVLEYRADPYGEAPDILIAPDHVRAAIEPMKMRHEREEWLMEHGYLLKGTPEA